MFLVTSYKVETVTAGHMNNSREFLCLHFAKKSVRNDKFKDLLPVNTKFHKMSTRNYEKFHINNANTARLENSPVIFMQKLLNQNNWNLIIQLLPVNFCIVCHVL